MFCAAFSLATRSACVAPRTPSCPHGSSRSCVRPRSPYCAHLPVSMFSIRSVLATATRAAPAWAPVAVGMSAGVAWHVAAPSPVSCAAARTECLSWGYNQFGQLGQGDDDDRALPEVIQDLENKHGVTAVSHGSSNSSAVITKYVATSTQPAPSHTLGAFHVVWRWISLRPWRVRSPGAVRVLTCACGVRGLLRQEWRPVHVWSRPGWPPGPRLDAGGLA